MTEPEGYRDPVDPNWLIFFATIIGMGLLAAAVIVGINTVRANHREDEISRRAKYEACQAVENEPSRIVCINGWR